MSRIMLIVGVMMALSCTTAWGLKIGAFNIKWLTWNKVNKPEAIGPLKQILVRYDVALIQEVRGDAPKIAAHLVEELNSVSESPYGFVVSDKLGRTRYKEEYVYIYKLNMISITNVDQFDDGPEEEGIDLFEREPYSIVVHSSSTSVKDFIIIGIHVKPDSVVDELKYLSAVEAIVGKKYQVEDIIIAGDMNADCRYLSNDELENSLLKKSRYTWLIDSDVDTTVGDTDCAYDRFVVIGANMLKAIVPGSAGAYNFTKTLKITKEEAYAVSDHYPIEFDIV